MRCNESGRALIRDFEGLRFEAYRCPAGVWTIGYGHTAGVQEGDVCTCREAEQWLTEDLEEAEEAVAELVAVALGGNQHAALCSWTFNLGRGALFKSTLKNRINASHYDEIPGQLKRWVKATDPDTGKKITLAGLVRRRAAEAELWERLDGETPGLA